MDTSRRGRCDMESPSRIMGMHEALYPQVRYERVRGVGTASALAR